jgi:hypothetical protein
MDSFKVGSFVWYIDPEKPLVKHYLVLEEIVKNSVSGQTKEYIFEAINRAGKTGQVSSKTLDGNFFTEKTAVHAFMLDQANEAIDRLLSQVERKPASSVNLKSSSETPVNNSEKSEDTIIELPDGTKARLKGGIPK